ncbi:MAG: [FeFe] hydrogenase H-cluster radical SAM maturase HydE [Candidatus Coatesbacteria bacterium]|nr:[FeFe] hydrogenase H-cluster radical SAM maturase HydE [Candidatus Coatesbacteria bacterium]
MDKEEVLYYLKSLETNDLFKKADSARSEFCGNKVFVRGIVEFSNNCIRNCKYCGIRRDNKNINRYRMTQDEILESVKKIDGSGLNSVVLQSGDDFFYTQKDICLLLERIKYDYPDMAITLSIGERHLEDYKEFRKSGADRYLLKHETVDNELYKFMHPNQSLSHRLRILNYLRELDYQVGTGFIIGLPFQKLEDIASDILFLEDFQPDMAGIGPFISQQDTPLADAENGSIEISLKTLALSRIVTRNSHLPATTALASIETKNGHVNGLKAGCNVIMISFTPVDYKENYKIYDKRACFELEEVKRSIEKAGRVFSGEKGDSLKS